jgi:hypothetical protein
MTDWPAIGSRWKRAPQKPAREQALARSSQAVLLVKEVEPREPAGREIRGLIFKRIEQMEAGDPYTTDQEGFWRGWEPLLA